jgi:rod shape-determining protein MreC
MMIPSGLTSLLSLLRIIIRGSRNDKLLQVNDYTYVMKKLLRSLYDYRNLLIFLLLESVSLSLLFNHHVQKEVKNLNSSHAWIGNIYELMTDLRMYAKWKGAYQDMLVENASLREYILQQQEIIEKQGSMEQPTTQLDVIPAQVINNSIIYTKNYLTINKGTNSGIAPGMGVITKDGVVGRVKAVSEHFATIISLLHTDIHISAKLASSGVMGTLCWLGHSPRQVNLLYIPRHLTIEVGDRVVTSGYNATFYEGVPIGKVSHVKLDKAAMFYEILVDLTTDLSALQHVYVVKNHLSQEQDSLEQTTKAYYE